MTTETVSVLAVPHSGGTVIWESINWTKCHRSLRKLQARIAKAVKRGRWRAARRLQRLLVRSRSAMLIAVKTVTKNRGKKTPGVDGITWLSSSSKSKAVLSLSSKGYRAQPLRRVYIPKSNGKQRPLGIPTMADRARQCLHNLALVPVEETLADPQSYGFRSKRSTADAIEQCFSVLSRKGSAQWIFEGDIKGCFDNISHIWIQDNVPVDKRVLLQWLKAGFIDKNTWHPTEAGTPQGGIISPTLMNMVLDGLETMIREKFPKNRSGHTKYKVHFIRYADDFIITAVSIEVLEQEVKPLVEEFLSERGLQLSEEKTKITHISEGFDFLGQNIRKYDGKLIIKPSRKSQKSFKQKVKEALRAMKAKSQQAVIGKLNPIIRGWANYHRHVCSKKVFNSMDHWIFRKLWRWAKRRHPGKSTQWIKDRYFVCEESRDWIFQASMHVVKGKLRKKHPLRDKTGKVKRPAYPTLVSMSDTPIQRHIKIRSAANPFDPAWKGYFQKRSKWKAGLRKKLHNSTGTTIRRDAAGSCIMQGFFRA